MTLRCQRCLEALVYRVDSEMSLALVSGMDGARQLPERYDPLLVSDRLIRPRDLIEDELLLALPQIPMHDPEACKAMSAELDVGQEQSGKANAFAVLADLKRGR
jgi:uncharacterized protein